MVLESLVILGDKLFCPNDARVGKVSCTVFETVDPAYFEIFFLSFSTVFSDSSLLPCPHLSVPISHFERKRLM